MYAGARAEPPPPQHGETPGGKILQATDACLGRRIHLTPRLYHGHLVKRHGLAPLRRRGHVGHEIELTGAQQVQAVRPGTRHIGNAPVLFGRDPIQQPRGKTRRNTIVTGVDLRGVLIQAHPQLLLGLRRRRAHENQGTAHQGSGH